MNPSDECAAVKHPRKSRRPESPVSVERVRARRGDELARTRGIGTRGDRGETTRPRGPRLRPRPRRRRRRCPAGSCPARGRPSGRTRAGAGTRPATERDSRTFGPPASRAACTANTLSASNSGNPSGVRSAPADDECPSWLDHRPRGWRRTRRRTCCRGRPRAGSLAHPPSPIPSGSRSLPTRARTRPCDVAPVC